MLQRFEKFAGHIAVCYKSIQRIKSVEMTELGLKGTHVMCLFYLNRHREGLTAAELCTLCEEDKAAVSRTLAELLERGYIASVDSANQKRYRVRLTLTASGEEVAARVDALISRWVAAVGGELDDGERETFYRVLEKISANLKADFSAKHKAP